MKRMLPLLVSMFLLASMPGCTTTSNPRANLLIAQRSFIAVVESLATLRDAGEFDQGEIDDISSLIVTGDAILDEWTVAVVDGREGFDKADAFHRVFEKLIEYRKRGDLNE